jgi:hypothetical protein
MKTHAQTSKHPGPLPQAHRTTPTQQGNDDRNSDLAFYFLLATLVLGLVYFFVLPLFI